MSRFTRRAVASLFSLILTTNSWSQDGSGKIRIDLGKPATLSQLAATSSGTQSQLQGTCYAQAAAQAFSMSATLALGARVTLDPYFLAALAAIAPSQKMSSYINGEYMNSIGNGGRPERILGLFFDEPFIPLVPVGDFQYSMFMSALNATQKPLSAKIEAGTASLDEMREYNEAPGKLIRDSRFYMTGISPIGVDNWTVNYPNVNAEALGAQILTQYPHDDILACLRSNVQNGIPTTISLPAAGLQTTATGDWSQLKTEGSDIVGSHAMVATGFETIDGVEYLVGLNSWSFGNTQDPVKSYFRVRVDEVNSKISSISSVSFPIQRDPGQRALLRLRLQKLYESYLGGGGGSTLSASAASDGFNSISGRPTGSYSSGAIAAANLCAAAGGCMGSNFSMDPKAPAIVMSPFIVRSKDSTPSPSLMQNSGGQPAAPTVNTAPPGPILPSNAALVAWAQQSLQESLATIAADQAKRQQQGLPPDMDDDPEPTGGTGDDCWGEEMSAHTAQKRYEDGCEAKQYPYRFLLLLGLDLPGCDEDLELAAAKREAEDAQSLYEDCIRGS